MSQQHRSIYRSYEEVTTEDLARLRRTAVAELERFFARNPQWAWEHVLAVGFAQGGAEHYLRGERGIYDLDLAVWFARGPSSSARRPVVSWDWGPSKFGRCPREAPEYTGRAVDVKFWTIPMSGSDPIAAVRAWLQQRLDRCGDAAKFLARKGHLDVAHEPVVLLWPDSHYLEVSWDPGPPPPPDDTEKGPHRPAIGTAPP